MSALLSSLSLRGRTFVACGIAVLISGISLGMVDLTRVGILLLVLPLLTALLTQRHSLSFEVARQVSPARVQVDEPATVDLTMTNPSRTRSPLMAAQEELDYALGDRPTCVIPPLRRGQAHTVSYTVQSAVRGRHRLGPLELNVADPFGLTRREVALQSSTEVVVLPRVVSLGGDGSASHGVGSDGTIAHMVALQGEDDVTVRDYRDGDDLRRVHWPATARTGSLMVRQEDRPSMRRAVILLDSRESVHGPSISPSLEWGVTFAASVVAHCERQGYAVHLVTAGSRPGIGQVHSHAVAGMEALAYVTPGPDSDLDGVLHTASSVVLAGGLVVAVIGACSDDDARAVAGLRAPGAVGIALVVDRTTRAGPTGHLVPGARALATVEVLRRAGWNADLVDADATWSGLWQRLRAGRVTSGAAR